MCCLVHSFKSYSWIGVLLLSLLNYLPTTAKTSSVVLDPQNTIIVHYVYNDNAWYSAAELKKWLQKIYQTESGFEIINERFLKETDIQQKFIIALGPTRWGGYGSIDELGKYGFAIQRKSNVITIVGSEPEEGSKPNDLNGIILGSVYFLDKYCGVRMYMPGDLFVGLPSKNKVVIPESINITQRPFTEQVMGTGFANQQEASLLELQWARFNGLWRKDWESHQHSMFARFPPVKFAGKYPEIYPLFDGQRYIPKDGGDQQWQPDFAEPHLVDAAVESAIDYFKEKPAIDYISFSVQDSRRFSMEGKMGEALKQYPADKQGEAYTDLYVKFINKVAERLEKELPKNGIKEPKTIVYLGYSNVNMVPKEKLHPRVLPIAVFRVAEIDVKSALNEANGANPASVKDWLKVTKRFGIHDWAQGNGYFFPRIYSDQYAKLLRFIKSQGAILEYAHIESYPNWGLDGPKYYIMGQVLWNPDSDTDVLLTRFCNDLFGRANKEMKDYFITLEQLTQSMNNNPQRMRKLFMFPQQLLLDAKEIELVKKARIHIDKAAKLARTPEEKQRVALFSKTFKVSEYLFEVANAKEVKKAKLEEINKYVNEVVAPDRMTFYAARHTGQLQGMVKNALDKAAANRVVN